MLAQARMPGPSQSGCNQGESGKCWDAQGVAREYSVAGGIQACSISDSLSTVAR